MLILKGKDHMHSQQTERFLTHEPGQVLDGKRICFVGRGGAGKSTCLVLVAEALCRRGYEVCVLDADSTNLGLHTALGMRQAPEPLIGHYGGMIFQGGRVGCLVDDPTLLTDPLIDLDRLPLPYQATNGRGITLLQTGKLADFGVGAGCDGPMIKLARDIGIQRSGHPIVLLVDFKAGLEDTSRGALIGMDAIVAVCDPSSAAIQAAITLNRILSAQNSGDLPSTGHLETPNLADLMLRLYSQWHPRPLYLVLNKIADEATRAYIEAQLEDSQLELAASIPDSAFLREAWLRGEELGASETESVTPLLSRLETDLIPMEGVIDD
jgi:CO dehydrogenase nickel-insertion accessory protein CooC1